MMSLGIRSGVNCTRRKSRASACPSERTSSVLPSPGTPSSRQWPPANRPISSCSTTASWPTMAAPMARRRRPSSATRMLISGSVIAVLMGQGSPSRAQRVHHDVDAEAGVVLGQEALVAPVVVPLAAVVLVAVQHPEAAVELDALEVFV